MLNEGIITNSTGSLVKSEMIRQLQKLGTTTPDQWERAVFHALTNHKREDIDWDFEDNQAGYYTWVKAFDGLVQELVDDGYAKVTEKGKERTISPTETDPPIDYSFVSYPSR